jgi:hypothetical protein
MESALDKLLYKVRVAKNYGVKVALAAGMTAGAAAAKTGMNHDEIVAASKEAAAEADGTEKEQKTAAARAIQQIHKDNGALYRLQSEAAAKIMNGEHLAEESVPLAFLPSSRSRGVCTATLCQFVPRSFQCCFQSHSTPPKVLPPPSSTPSSTPSGFSISCPDSKAHPPTCQDHER